MPGSNNGLLASLSTNDFDFAPRMRDPIGLRKNLERPNRRIDAVYFPEVGFASVVAVQSKGKQVEVGLIGREGMTGLPIVLGNHRSPMRPIFKCREGASAYPRRIAQGDPDQRIAPRLVVEVRAGVWRANNTHRNLQRTVPIRAQHARFQATLAGTTVTAPLYRELPFRTAADPVVSVKVVSGQVAQGVVKSSTQPP